MRNETSFNGSRIRTTGIIGAIAIAVIAACSSSSSGGGAAPACPPPDGCPAPDPATTQLDTPVVSFAKDVLPTFQGSCALSTSCHQQKQAGPSLLYLGGSASQPADAPGIIAAIVGVASVELPSMPYVTVGDPTKSYLMHKLDGDVCLFASQCGATPAASCGTAMPQSSCALDGATRDAIRRWIAQGAKNN